MTFAHYAKWHWDRLTLQADRNARAELDARDVPNDERPPHLTTSTQHRRDEEAGRAEHPRRRWHR